MSQSHKKKVRLGVKGTKRRNAWIFGLGGLFGMWLAATFVAPTGSLDKLVDLVGMSDMHLGNLLDVIPIGLINDVKDLQVSLANGALTSG